MYVPVDVKKSTMTLGKGRAPRMASKRFCARDGRRVRRC